MVNLKRIMQLREWASQVEDWRRSGMTMTQYAKEHNISRNTFKYRRRQVENCAEEILTGDVAELLRRNTIIEYGAEDMPQIAMLPKPDSNCYSEQMSKAFTVELDLNTGVIRATNDASIDLLRELMREVFHA